MAPIALMSGEWTEGADRGKIRAVWNTFAGVLHHAGKLISVPLYNCRDLPESSTEAEGESALCQVTRVCASECRITRSSVVNHIQIQIAPSSQDALHLLTPNPALPFVAETGIALDFGFSFGTGSILASAFE